MQEHECRITVGVELVSRLLLCGVATVFLHKLEIDDQNDCDDNHHADDTPGR